MSKSPNLYRRYHFQAQIIRSCIWLYGCYWLAYQNFHVTIAQTAIAFYKPTGCRYKQFWLHFLGQFQFRSQPGDKRNLGKILLQLNSRTDACWQTVNQDGNLLSILVQNRGNQMTVRPWFRPLLKKLRDILLVIMIHQLKSHSVAKQATLASTRHYHFRQLNFRAKNLPQLV